MSMVPNTRPNIPSQGEVQLGNFMAAKDMMDRNPGGSKKKWPLIVAGVLLALVAALFVGLYLTSGSSEETLQIPGVQTAVSQQAAQGQ